MINFSITDLFMFGGAIGDWLMEILYKMLLFFDGLGYTLLAYAFKLFQLMCTLNFNSLSGIVAPILTRIEALIMVFVVYKLGITLINFMLKPEDASKKGKEILINIFIAAALLISYNTIFGIFNELSMLIIGTPDSYSFTYLGQIADLTESKDSGLINRIVFGTDENVEDMGEFIAFSICSSFITRTGNPRDTSDLEAEIGSTTNPGHADFFRLPNIASQIGKKFDYFPVVGFAAAIYMIFSFVKSTIQVGVRAFKLLVLQILAPVAIISVIGEGVKGKTFKNFLNKYISVYIELFIRMFSILLVCTFIVKFISNIGDYIPNISTDEWYTYALMLVLIIIAALKFAGDIPKFIDEILSTHLGDGKSHNFLKDVGAIVGAGAGAAAGAAAGAVVGGIAGGAGGGLGGAIAGIGSGLVGGARSGAKGKNVADWFKGQAQVGKNAKATGQSVAARGGLGQTIAGGIEKGVGVGSAHDRALAKLDKQSRALDELEAAEKFAVKDSKMGTVDNDGKLTSDFDKTWGANQEGYSADTAEKYFTDTYSGGYNDIKLGEDKDAYAAKMLDYDKAYQEAQARYDNLSSSTNLDTYTQDLSSRSADLEAAKRELEDRRTRGASEAEISAQEAVVTAAQSRYDTAQRDYNDHAAPVMEAKRAAEEARARAEKRAKDYYDARKRHEGDQSDDVRKKRRDYESVAPKSNYKDSDGRTIERSDATKRTDEKRRIHDEKAEITNSHSYQRTHGGNPKK